MKRILLSTILLLSLVGAGFSQDQGWPRQLTRQGETLVYYQPQVDDWSNYAKLVARMAITLTPRGGTSVAGILTLEATTQVGVETHTVLFSDIKITHTHFPFLDDANAAKMDALARTFMPQSTTISLDRLVACVQKSGDVRVVQVKNDPPKIFVSYKPALLLQVDGEPVQAPIPKTSLEYIINTPWPLFMDRTDSQYYLLADKQWLSAAKLEGPWSRVTTLPRDVSILVRDPQWADLKKAVPPPLNAQGPTPSVFYSTSPAQIIQFVGRPAYASIPGTGLFFASNTDSDLLLFSPKKQFFYLVAGRWFRSDHLEGPWVYATPDLPPDFSRIPEDSPAAGVLTSVPGTEDAKDAVLIAQIPTTAVVDPVKAAERAKVTYGGEPRFKPIDGTSLSYAANTADKVIKVADLYYLCLYGIWFMSKSPEGPWKTAESLPQDISKIPPSSPVYNVSYVTQTIAPGGFVETSYTAGYFGSYSVGVSVGVVVTSGTGYYYPPYLYYPLYGNPFYYPSIPTYGVPYYNTRTGAYGVGGAAYGPYAGAAWGTQYNPYTGTYARGAAAYGPLAAQSAAQVYNPYTGAYGASWRGSNAYAQWGASVVSKGNQAVFGQRYTDSRGTVGSAQSASGARVVGARGSQGSAFAGRTSGGDLYAGRDGNVYRNSGTGWQRYENGAWHPINRAPAAGSQADLQRSGSPTSDLQRDFQNRHRGEYQSQRFQSAAAGRFSGGGIRRR